MKRSSRITIHPEALQHNLKRAKQAAPNSKTLAVIKADAYGHGAVATAGILYEIADGFAVSCIPEAVELRDAGITKPITILQGHQSADDLRAAAHFDLRLTVHNDRQLSLLDQYSHQHKTGFEVNLKIDTGMHRLGFHPDRAADVFQKLSSHSQVNADQLILMTHLSCADELDNKITKQQLTCFADAEKGIASPTLLTKSIANSAGILGWEDSHSDWIRPGIMLYGSSPFATSHRDEHDLKAAMTLNAPIIAIHDLKKGDNIGYGATWQCPTDMKVAIIACGYADGYPRHAASGTPVWINSEEAQLVGRVSMDMIVVDISHFEDKNIQVGDLAELWGKNLSVDRIAQSADTIAYELLCNAGIACERI
ncbi:MAG: alanine racemase [Cocleimonas sp.]|nr:alanine racemase [Cocleimonas sp.]